MKVKIGPYVNWFGIYQIADKIFFWIDDRKSIDYDEFYNRWDVKLRDSFTNWLSKTWVHDFCVWLYKFQKRKIEVRLDPYDTWSLDHTLALIIHPALIQLRDTNHGYGMIDPEDCPSIGKGDETDYGTSDDKALDRWNWFMDEIIWAFGEIANDNPNEPKFNSGGDEMIAYHNRIQNAMVLFGKYYRALWD
jgi:hypothetical protein